MIKGTTTPIINADITKVSLKTKYSLNDVRKNQDNKYHNYLSGLDSNANSPKGNNFDEGVPQNCFKIIRKSCRGIPKNKVIKTLSLLSFYLICQL
jgi:hypothetical protein